MVGPAQPQQEREDEISLVIATDRRLMADALRAALGQGNEASVRAAVETVAGALRAVAEHPGAIAVVNIRLLVGPDSSVTVQGRRLCSTARTLAVTDTISRHVVMTALDAGCAGVASALQPLDTLVDAIRVVHMGGTYLPVDVGSLLHRDRASLSGRELRVLVSVASGSTTPEIARELGISVHTVRNHVKQILAKLGCHSKLQAVTVAIDRGIISRPSLEGPPR